MSIEEEFDSSSAPVLFSVSSVSHPMPPGIPRGLPSIKSKLDLGRVCAAQAAIIPNVIGKTKKIPILQLKVFVITGT